MRRLEKGSSSTSRQRTATLARSTPAFPAMTRSAASVGSPLAIHRPSSPRWRCARFARTATRQSVSSTGSSRPVTARASVRTAPSGSYPAPVTSSSRPSAQIVVTVICPAVSVPVLSVQMTVTEPSVSTDGSRLTSA